MADLAWDFGFLERILRSKAKPSPKPKAIARAEVKELVAQITTLIKPMMKERGATGPQSFIETLFYELGKIEAEEAQERAAWLLDRQLSAEQRKSLAKQRSFLVKGKTMTYRITADAQVHVAPSKNYAAGGTFLCIMPTGGLPVADRILSMKLMIEGAEEEFLKIANPGGDHRYKLLADGTFTPKPVGTMTPLYDLYRQFYDLGQMTGPEYRRLANQGIPALPPINYTFNPLGTTQTFVAGPATFEDENTTTQR